MVRFLLFVLPLAFQVWMLVDAARRREMVWLLIILFFPGLGAIAYFLVYKVHELDTSWLRRLTGAGRPNLRQLRRAVDQTPSVVNRVALADALLASGEHQEAAVLYRGVLVAREEDRPALFGLGKAELLLGNAGAAVQQFGKLVELEPGYRDYEAALEYAEALYQADRLSDAIELLEDLCAHSSRLERRVALAYYLLKAERRGDAREVLEKGLRDYEGQADFVRRRDRQWARRAERMLAKASAR